MDLQRVVLHKSKLPTVPKVAQVVISGLSSGEATLGQIAHWIRADPVLSMRLLRLANSAYFQVTRTVESVDDALQLLGLSTVRNLALGSGLLVAFSDVTGLDLTRFWRHSLRTAAAAGWLATQCREDADHAFTLGLIQGVGQLQLHVAAPAAMQALDGECPVFDPRRTDLERKVLGFDFGSVSAALARNWNFPPALALALEAIHRPDVRAEDAALAAIVRLAYWRVSEDTLAPSLRPDFYPVERARALDLAPGWAFSDITQCPADWHGGRTLPLLPDWNTLVGGMDVLLS